MGIPRQTKIPFTGADMLMFLWLRAPSGRGPELLWGCASWHRFWVNGVRLGRPSAFSKTSRRSIPVVFGGYYSPALLVYFCTMG